MLSRSCQSSLSLSPLWRPQQCCSPASQRPQAALKQPGSSQTLLLCSHTTTYHHDQREMQLTAKAVFMPSLIFGALVTTCSQIDGVTPDILTGPIWDEVILQSKRQPGHTRVALSVSRAARTWTDLLPRLSWQIRRRSAFGCRDMRVTSAQHIPCNAYILGEVRTLGLQLRCCQIIAGSYFECQAVAMPTP